MSNIINLFGKLKKEEKKLEKKPVEKKLEEKIEENLENLEEAAKKEVKEGFDFAATMKKNKENADRVAQDKIKANKAVTRSYNLKK